MTPPRDELEAFMAAIRDVESGGEEDPYRARGPAETKWGRAQGAYQMMSGIWPSWASKYGYDGLSQADFLANRGGVQDSIAAARMSDYYERYNGQWDLVAAAWFAGQGNADKAQKHGIQALAGMDDGFTEVPVYVDKVMKGFGGSSPDLSGMSTADRQLMGQAERGAEQQGLTAPTRTPARNLAQEVIKTASEAAMAGDPDANKHLQLSMQHLYRYGDTRMVEEEQQSTAPRPDDPKVQTAGGDTEPAPQPSEEPPEEEPDPVVPGVTTGSRGVR